MRLYLKLIIIVIFLCRLPAEAQMTDSSGNKSSDSTKAGYVIYRLPPGLNSLVEKYRKINYSSPGIDGYRVQIFSESGNNAKERANSALQNFSTAFGDVDPYLTYEQPNFKVRCGDFRTRAEARQLQKRISSEFPGAFIVKDHIKVN